MESLRVAILKLCTKEGEVNDPLDRNYVFSLLGYTPPRPTGF